MTTKLSDIINTDIASDFNNAKAATDFEPLPKGTYTAHIESGELSKSKGGTPSYKLTFNICEGEYQNRKVWHDIWLTAAALPMAKRDLAKIGITKLEQCEQKLPSGLRCKLIVTLRTSDDGAVFNRLRKFEVIGLDKDVNVDDEFAPADTEGGEL